MTWPMAQVRHIARLEYGSSLPAGDRIDGDVAVFGSNGPVGRHNSSNTGSPVVVVGRKGSHGKLQYSPSPVFAIDTTYFIDPACTQANIRWLYYSLSTLGLDKVGQDVGVPGLSREYAYSQRVPLPSRPEQRAIADYLDIETSRIDTLITKKRRMIELLEERVRSLRDQWFENLSSEYGLVSLRRWWSRIEQGWSPVCDSEPAKADEWGVIKTSAVSTGVFVPDNNKRLPADRDLDMRWLLRDGDLLVTRGSGSRPMVGKACVARVGQRKLTLSDLVYRVRLLRTNPDFAAAAMSSSAARSQIERSIRTDVGQTLKVRRDDLAGVHIPKVPYESQAMEYRNLARTTSPLQKAALSIEKQLELLGERREALITSAVTGQFSVPCP